MTAYILIGTSVVCTLHSLLLLWLMSTKTVTVQRNIVLFVDGLCIYVLSCDYWYLMISQFLLTTWCFLLSVYSVFVTCRRPSRLHFVRFISTLYNNEMSHKCILLLLSCELKGNSLDKLRHTRSVVYSVELVLLNKHQISGGWAYLDSRQFNSRPTKHTGILTPSPATSQLSLAENNIFGISVV